MNLLHLIYRWFYALQFGKAALYAASELGAVEEDDITSEYCSRVRLKTYEYLLNQGYDEAQAKELTTIALARLKISDKFTTKVLATAQVQCKITQALLEQNLPAVMQ